MELVESKFMKTFEGYTKKFKIMSKMNPLLFFIKLSLLFIEMIRKKKQTDFCPHPKLVIY